MGLPERRNDQPRRSMAACARRRNNILPEKFAAISHSETKKGGQDFSSPLGSISSRVISYLVLFPCLLNTARPANPNPNSTIVDGSAVAKIWLLESNSILMAPASKHWTEEGRAHPSGVDSVTRLPRKMVLKDPCHGSGWQLPAVPGPSSASVQALV
jgi:hypothetical protein